MGATFDRNSTDAAFQAVGFYAHGTGGGCAAYRRDYHNSAGDAFALITAGGGDYLPDTPLGGLTVGYYELDENGEELDPDNIPYADVQCLADAIDWLAHKRRLGQWKK